MPWAGTRAGGKWSGLYHPLTLERCVTGFSWAQELVLGAWAAWGLGFHSHGRLLDFGISDVCRLLKCSGKRPGCGGREALAFSIDPSASLGG